LEYKYDILNRLTEETQLGIKLYRTYDHDSRVTSLTFLGKTIEFKRNSVNNLIKINNIGMDYDKNNNLIKIKYPNNQSEIKLYTKINEVDKIMTANKTFYYDYDKTGLII